MKWFIVWAVLYVTPHGPEVMGTEETKKFDSEALCEAYRLRTLPQMPDWFRGFLNIEPDAEIHLDGRCKPVGDPA